MGCCTCRGEKVVQLCVLASNSTELLVLQCCIYLFTADGKLCVNHADK
jgi:hypothetical protein